MTALQRCCSTGKVGIQLRYTSRDLNDPMLVEARDSWRVLYGQVGGSEKYESADRTLYPSSKQAMSEIRKDLVDSIKIRTIHPLVTPCKCPENPLRVHGLCLSDTNNSTNALL